MKFSIWGYLLRLFIGIIIVFGTYNPFSFSYFHWVFTTNGQFNTNFFLTFDAFKALVGVALLIGWFVYLYATGRSMGKLGTFLAVLFFGLIFWLIFQLLEGMNLDKTTMTSVIYTMLLLLVAFVLSTGVYWSVVWRWLTGQVNVDDVDEDTN